MDANPSRDARAGENDLAIRYYPMVKAIARRMAAKWAYRVDTDDLTSFGVFGLLDAITKFDPARGVPFQTYAFKRIYGTIIDHVRRNDWIKRPGRIKQKKDPSITFPRMLSLHDRGEHGDEVGSNVTATPIHDAVAERDFFRFTKRFLTPRECLVLDMRYLDCLSFAQIGQAISVSETRAFTVNREILCKLRKKLGLNAPPTTTIARNELMTAPTTEAMDGKGS